MPQRRRSRQFLRLCDDCDGPRIGFPGPARFETRQGQAMGRPGLLRVDVPPSGGIVVTGSAVAM